MRSAPSPGSGCSTSRRGPATWRARAAERGADAVGIDRSETMIAYARANSPNVEFVLGDATGLPFGDTSFDAVIAAFLLLHLGRPEEAVSEAARVLVSGGRAAFTVWDEPSRSRWLGVVFDAFVDAGAQPPPEIPNGPPFFALADEQAFTRLLTDNGLLEVSVETVQFPLRLESGKELWAGLIEGSVRVRPLILGQPPRLQHAIRARFDELLEEYRAEQEYDVPVSVKLASGRKP